MALWSLNVANWKITMFHCPVRTCSLRSKIRYREAFVREERAEMRAGGISSRAIDLRSRQRHTDPFIAVMWLKQ